LITLASVGFGKMRSRHFAVELSNTSKAIFHLIKRRAHQT